MSLTQYSHIQAFLDYLRFEKRYSQHTLISYQNDLEQFFSFLYAQFNEVASEQINQQGRQVRCRVRPGAARARRIEEEIGTFIRRSSTINGFGMCWIRLQILCCG